MDNDCSVILDSRTLAQLGKETISGYGRAKVKRALQKSLTSGETEAACYWGAELLCSLRPEDAWEELIGFYAQHINLGSTNLPVYLSERINNFKAIAMAEDENDLRNNYDVRRIFAEVTAILSMSRRRTPLHTPSRLGPSPFEITSLTSKLRAKRSDLSVSVMQHEDPGEIHIPINELMHHLTAPAGDLTLACFWVDWLIAYTTAAKKAKQRLLIVERDWVIPTGQLKRHPIWLVWHCCRSATKEQDKHVKTVINALLNIFSLRFRESTSAKRRHLMYTAIAVVIDGPKKPVPICSNVENVTRAKNGIDLVYRQIKSREHKPRLMPHQLET